MDRCFIINEGLLPERFTVVGAISKGNNEYVVIGKEYNTSYCSWIYSPNYGFVHGHYRLTEEEALKDLIERG